MNPVKYDSPSDVYKRLAQAGIVSSSDVIQRAIQGFYRRELKEQENPIGSDQQKFSERANAYNSPASQIKRHAIRKSLEGIE